MMEEDSTNANEFDTVDIAVPEEQQVEEDNNVEVWFIAKTRINSRFVHIYAFFPAGKWQVGRYFDLSRWWG